MIAMSKSEAVSFMQIPRSSGTLRNGKREICQATSGDFMIRPLQTAFQGGTDGQRVRIEHRQTCGEKLAIPRACRHEGIVAAQGTLRLCRSNGFAELSRCSLYPEKRTSLSATRTSALGQMRTFAKPRRTR